MKVKDLFKQVEGFNEVAKANNSLHQYLGRPDKARLYYKSTGQSPKEFSSYNEFKDWIKENWIESFAKAVLSCDEFEFNKVVEIKNPGHHEVKFFVEIDK